MECSVGRKLIDELRQAQHGQRTYKLFEFDIEKFSAHPPSKFQHEVRD